MGYVSDNNLINYLPLSTTTQSHLFLTHCSGDVNGNDHHQLIPASSEELHDGKSNIPAAATSRWNPTPEQITTLEELYRSGTRTPTTEEIQKIASKLRKYGRIEGKNVFYWFQNHKARERLKRRRREGAAINNNNGGEPHQDVKDSPSGGYRLDRTKSCLSFPHTDAQPQHELVPASYNKDNNANNEDHGTTEEESEKASEGGKDVTWRNLVTSSITQEPAGEINIDGEVETREIRTLNLFPVLENQEKTSRFKEMKNTNANQVCCNYCFYYEFLPLKN